MQLFTTTDGSTGSSGTSSSSSVAQSSTGTDTSEMFTQLLIAQIKNQNPLDPADPSEFVTQLSQLSQVEALQQLVSQNSGNNAVLDSLQTMALGAQVGSTVAVRSTSVTLGDSAISGSFSLQSASSSTQLVLTDSSGVKHTIELGAQGVGTVDFSLDRSTLGLPAGSYTLAVKTSSSESPSIDLLGTLQSVRLSASGSVVMNVDGLGEVDATQVSGFLGKTGTSQS